LLAYVSSFIFHFDCNSVLYRKYIKHNGVLEIGTLLDHYRGGEWYHNI
jgi:hypothetical protein